MTQLIVRNFYANIAQPYFEAIELEVLLEEANYLDVRKCSAP